VAWVRRLVCLFCESLPWFKRMQKECQCSCIINDKLFVFCLFFLQRIYQTTKGSVRSCFKTLIEIKPPTLGFPYSSLGIDDDVGVVPAISQGKRERGSTSPIAVANAELYVLVVFHTQANRHSER